MVVEFSIRFTFIPFKVIKTEMRIFQSVPKSENNGISIRIWCKILMCYFGNTYYAVNVHTNFELFGEIYLVNKYHLICN